MPEYTIELIAVVCGDLFIPNNPKTMRHLDEYKHLDYDPNYRIRMEMTMPEVVKAVVAQNYGTHRFLSALVHELRAKQDAEYPSELAPIIEDALNRGFFY